MPSRPSVLVFDVNETLIDIESLEPHFETMFGDPRVLREWFGQLVTYSMTVTLSDTYIDFFSLGQAVLRMTADIHGVKITDDDLRALSDGMQTMPAHPDVAEGLRRLKEQGYRIVTLTNLSSQPERPDAARARGPRRLLRAAIQRRRVTCLQAVVSAVQPGGRGVGGRTVGVHDGRRSRVGHHGCTGRRIRRRSDHPTRQRTAARTRPAATDSSGGRSDRASPATVTYSVLSRAISAASSALASSCVWRLGHQNISNASMTR